MSTPQLHSALSLEQWEQLEHDLFDGAGLALTTLRDYARAHYLPPVGFLVASCLRVLSSLPGNATFNAGVGKGSMNLFVALVAPPGGGKDRLMQEVNSSITVTAGNRSLEPLELPLGSGEGVAVNLQPEEGQPASNPVLFGASEVGEVAALMGRKGSTLRSNLLKIYSGNALGYTNKGEKFRVEAHSYTAGLWMGVQPDKAGALLDGEDDGLRHRFVWTELVDPTKQGRSDNPPAAPHTVAVPGTITNGASMSFHEGIVEETRQMMAVTLKYGVQGHNAGHRHQTRLKLAAGLALLRSADTVDLEDWRRAGVLMDYSDIVQGDCLAHLQGQRERDAAHRLEQRERAEEQATANRRERFRTKVLKELKDGNTLVRSQVLQSVRGDQRELMNAVLDTLELEGLITVTEGDRGRVFLQRNPHCPEGGK